jgi:metal-sulfur cluster biosynthetic enzyme
MTSTNDLGSPLTQGQTTPTARANSKSSNSLDEDFVQPLSSVSAPEVGLNIVDLGLVSQAKWTTDGISVSMTMTTPSCPMAEMLAEEVRAVLRRQFPDTTIIVDVSRDPQWTPARISEAGRRQLGWNKRSESRKRRPRS